MDTHHVKHWCDRGDTFLDNLITLCRHHHRLVHQAGFEITTAANGEFVFKQPDGMPLPRALPHQFADAAETGDILAIARQHAALGLAIDAGTSIPLWQGEDCDYGLTVDALMRSSYLKLA